MPCGGVSEGKLVLFSPHPRLSFSSFSGIVSAFSGGHNISLQMSCLQYLQGESKKSVISKNMAITALKSIRKGKSWCVLENSA